MISLTDTSGVRKLYVVCDTECVHDFYASYKECESDTVRAIAERRRTKECESDTVRAIDDVNSE